LKEEEGMAEKHSYAAELAQKISQRGNNKIVIKFRTMLKGFGYYRRTQAIVDELKGYLQEFNLHSDFNLNVPRDLDERVTIQLTLPPQSPLTNKPVINQTATKVIEKNQIEQAIDATVEIYTDNGCGSGFVVHPHGLVVTARHLINDEDHLSRRTVKVLLFPEKPGEKEVEGIVVRSHRTLDFALVWLMEERVYPYIKLGDSNAIKHIDTVYAVGAPTGKPNTVSRGIISNPHGRFRGIDCIQTDAAIDHGNSGGPLVNTNGEVLGVNLWGIGQYDALKFAVPIDYIREDIDEVLRKGRDVCVSATYCPSCGYLDYEDPTWFCRNCGCQWEQKSDERKTQGITEHVIQLMKEVLLSYEIQPDQFKQCISFQAIQLNEMLGLVGVVEIQAGAFYMVANVPLLDFQEDNIRINIIELQQVVVNIEEYSTAHYDIDQAGVYVKLCFPVQNMNEKDANKAIEEMKPKFTLLRLGLMASALKLQDEQKRGIISEAWPPFALRLAAALEKLKEDQYLILLVKRSNRYVQFAAQGFLGMRIETTSNSYMPEPEQLNERQISTLLDEGWHAPTGSSRDSTPNRDPDGSPNFFVEFAAPVSFEAVSNLAVRTLAEILHIPHPGFLEYEAFDEKGKGIALPELGLRMMDRKKVDERKVILPNIKMTPDDAKVIYDVLMRCDENTQKIYNLLMEKWSKAGYFVETTKLSIVLDAPYDKTRVRIAILLPGISHEINKLNTGVSPESPVIILIWESLRKHSGIPDESIDQYQRAVRKIVPLHTTKSSAHIEKVDSINLDVARNLLKSMIDLAKSVRHELVEERKPAKTVTPINIESTLAQCDEKTRDIFQKIMDAWKKADGDVLCGKVGRIDIKLKTKAHSSGKNAKLARNFNIAVLACPKSRQNPNIQVTWDLAKDQPFAYLDNIPEAVTRYEKVVSSLPGFEHKGTITRLLIGDSFLDEHTSLLINSLIELKEAEADSD
jgi:S1-C subfamily serine protease